MRGRRTIILSMMNRGRGSAQVVSQQARAFSDHGYDCKIVTPQYDEQIGVPGVPVDLEGLPIPIHEYLPVDEPTIPAHSLPDSHISLYMSAYADAMSRAVVSSLRDGTPPQDILVFTHHANIHTVANEIVRSLAPLGIGHVIQPHGTCIRGYKNYGKITAFEEGKKDGYMWGLIQETLGRADRIVAVSQFVKDALITPYVGDEGKIIVVHNELSLHEGEDTEEIVRNLIHQGAMLDMSYVIQAGVLNEEKNPLGLAQASHAYGDQAQTVFIGSTKADFGERVVREGKNCFYLGRVSDEVRNALLASAEYIVSAHTSEDFGLTLIEAAALGTPAIGFPSGGVAEIIENARSGWLARDMENESLGLAIREGLRNKNRLELTGPALTEYTMQRFGFEETTAKVIELTEGVFRERGENPEGRIDGENGSSGYMGK